MALAEETKKCFKEIKNREKIVDKKKFRKYFSYETTSLKNNLLKQNTQGLNLNEFKSEWD